MFNRLDDDDGIVHDEPDRQYQAEQRQRVDGKAEHREEHEGPDEGNRHRQQRNQGRAPALQEDVDHEDHQDDGDQERLDDFLDAFRYGARRIQRDGVVDALWQATLLLREQVLDPFCRLNGIRTGQLIDGDQGARLAIQVAGDGVVLRAHLDAGNVLDAHDAAIGRGAHDNICEFFGRGQPALRADRIGELLSLGRRLTADLAGRVHRVLRLDGGDDLRYGDGESCQLIGFDPEAHGVLAGAEHLHAADALNAAQLIVEVDVRVVGEELRVINARGGKQADQHQRRGERLLHRDAEGVDFCRKLRSGLRLADLRQDEIGIRVGFHIEIDNQPHLACRRVHRIHVVQVVHAAHLLLDRRGDGVLYGLRIGADIGGADLHFRRRDGRELRDRQADDGNRANDHGENRDHDGDDRTIDEEFRHA